MTLILYNVANRRKEEFKPKRQPEVKMYSCGPTVYWSPHIGNFSAYFMSDILVRTLEYLGYKVKWVMNITDVGHMTNDEATADSSGEDKMEKAAKKEGVDVWEVAKKYEEEFFIEYDNLHLKRPDVICRATEHIEAMLNMVSKLIENGIAYETDDGVYFHVPAWEKYGKFSKIPMDDIIAGARVEVNENKKDPRDFALWVKCVGKHKNHIMRWDSPWGIGFPGWHIECSAMSTKYLGYNIDIHTGGVDHLFPHHECEIAQSEGALPKNNKKDYFVKYWIHKEHIKLNGEKISKSKANVIWPQDLLEKGYSYREMRYAMMSVHYRTEQNFTYDSMDQAKSSLNRIDEAFERLEEILNRVQDDKPLSQEWDEFMQDKNSEFLEYLEDDLNIPGALSVIFELVKEVNKRDLTQKEAKMTLDWFRSIDEVLGIMPLNWDIDNEIPEEIMNLGKQRQKAKEEKDFKKADKLRDKIEKNGFEIRDEQNSFKIKRK